MKKRVVVMLTVVTWVVAAAVAQEPPPPPEGGGAPGPRPPGDAGMMGEVFGTMRALRRVADELSEEQKAKLEKAQNEMSEKMKNACTDFEADLAGFLTAEEMQKYKTSREAAGNWGGRGRGQGFGGPGMGGRMAQMQAAMEVFRTFRALGTVENGLSEEQRAKLKEVCQSAVEKMVEDLEVEIGNILTANQMERFKKAKETEGDWGMGGRPRGEFGRRGPEPPPE